ncbi:hypothetical protein GCM10010309_45470 [Streptomyces violaceochromogenes]|nr:hypothetical protein GCM10010309_45470 [Streptomyces violaceochromogenes]
MLAKQAPHIGQGSRVKDDLKRDARRPDHSVPQFVRASAARRTPTALNPVPLPDHLPLRRHTPMSQEVQPVINPSLDH